VVTKSEGEQIFIFSTASRKKHFGAHQISCLMVTGDMSRQLKLLEREVNHSARTNAEVKNAWAYASIPPHKSLWLPSCRGALASKGLTGLGLPSGVPELAPTSSSESATVSIAALIT
jgi:hypothetical protein